MTAFRRLTIILAIVLASAYGYVVLRGPQGIPALLEKHREIQRLEAENAALKRELAAREERNRKIKEGTAIQEEEIRKRLHLLRPGETQFVLPDQPGAGAQR
ncbi:MAG: septum formation initiator family protein [Bryobacteraceae bacterium]|jgi:cell division protein FtsB